MSLDDNTGARDSHAVLDQMPVCRSMDFKWTAFSRLFVRHVYTKFPLAQNSTCAGPSYHCLFLGLSVYRGTEVSLQIKFLKQNKLYEIILLKMKG